MDPARFARVKELLLAAREVEPDAREAFVRERVGDDRALADEVLSLLDREARPARIVEEGVLPRELTERRGHPSQIGPYRIEGVLGEGGMGMVYHAVQEEPIRREVALKLVRRGRDSETTLRRFHWERQSLARMDHPNIASVLDAGADENGRPYFVMPLVVGRSLTEFCDQERLSIDERLRLFTTVCRAVQHAHQRGLLHRDLKPGNILVRRVDDVPVPTIIDFGIARALEDDPDELAAGLTLEGQRIGTPAYMSPEQLRGVDGLVDSRSDVYALGVILYELLAGRHPWADTGDRAPTDHRTGLAPLPSTALARSDVNARALERRTSARLLLRHLRGDLDTICTMAVRTEPDRRYASAAHLADDIDRHLRNEPVLARPDGWRYRTVKFVQRHPAGVATAVMLVLMGIGTTVLLAWHADRLGHERDRALVAEQLAQSEAAAARSMATFMEGLFTLAQPGGERDRGDLSARELLAQGVQRVPEELAGEPYLQARMLRALGLTHHALGLHAEAESLFTAAMTQLAVADDIDELQRKTELAAIHEGLAGTYHDVARFAEAVENDSLALDLYRQIHPGDHPDVVSSLNRLGISVQARGDVPRGIGHVREALEMQERLSTEPDAELAYSWGTLGYLEYKLGRVDDALAHMQHALELAREVFGTRDDFDVMYALNNYGGVLEFLGRNDEARPVLREALEMCERMYATGEHAALGRAHVNYARTFLPLRRFEEARHHFEAGEGVLLRTVGPDHPLTTNAMQGLAQVELEEGHFAVAESLLLAVKEIRETRIAPDHAVQIRTPVALGELYLRWGRPADALPHLEDFATRVDAQEPVGHYRRAEADRWLGRCLHALGRDGEALPLLRRSVDLYRTIFTDDHPDRIDAERALAEVEGRGAGR